MKFPEVLRICQFSLFSGGHMIQLYNVNLAVYFF